ncbi:MAG: DUF1365 domain-containing protein [Caulobacter sp.]|nr:DUF1365 domain-containing protein [Caulobacter sp.]
MTKEGLYRGVVTHVRHRPRRHALRYRIFMLLLDLDSPPTERPRLLGRGRLGLASFREADHGDRGDRPLAVQVRERLASAGIVADGPIRLLTMPRTLGHGFNPLSVYFCHAADGTLAAILHEVTNTFGERHFYLAPADRDAPVQRHDAGKQFYVSPFMDMEMRYRFTVEPPGARTGIIIEVDDAEGSRMTAAFAGAHEPLTDGSLLAAWLAHPLLSLAVVAGIHWEALQLVLKGLRPRARPRSREIGMTICRPAAGVRATTSALAPGRRSVQAPPSPQLVRD